MDEGKVVGLVVVNVAGDSPLAVTCSEVRTCVNR